MGVHNAFNSIEHSAIWSTLKHQSISEQYVVLLKRCTMDSPQQSSQTLKVRHS